MIKRAIMMSQLRCLATNFKEADSKVVFLLPNSSIQVHEFFLAGKMDSDSRLLRLYAKSAHKIGLGVKIRT